jgi:2-polyprenyl-6-methoxyphenol hydroxylase-like FAD-dependent oxidoreductase
MASTPEGRTGPRDSIPVLIVGAGPVGLTLAIDLAGRGIRSRVIEKRTAHGKLPKMERVNPRTLEHFRRLGIADRVRAAGAPKDLPMDVFVTETLFSAPLVRLAQESVRQLTERGAATFDGSMPLEPYHVVSQYTLEPLLREIAEERGVQVDFGHELVGFEADEESVSANIALATGGSELVDAQFLIGCDGGASTVRKSLSIGLEGDPRLLDVYQALVRSDDLFERLPYKGRHYHVLDEHQSFLIVQDDTRHFTLHTRLEDADQMAQRFREVVGAPVDFELLFCGPWTVRAMLADSYGGGRVYIAGDAAHLMPPNAGLGMNTGVGDAIDLAWKLQAVIQGWGARQLLDSYEEERRGIAAANIDYSVTRFRGRQAWRSEVTEKPALTHQHREVIAELVMRNEAKAGSMEGMELGYAYPPPPVIATFAGKGAPPAYAIEQRYVPATEPGARLPHVWVEPGAVAIQDLLPLASFTLLCLREDGFVVSEFARAFDEVSAPLTVLAVESHVGKHVYWCDFILLRPDMHIVWRGNAAPESPGDIVKTALRRM